MPNQPITGQTKSFHPSARIVLSCAKVYGYLVASDLYYMGIQGRGMLASLRTCRFLPGTLHGKAFVSELERQCRGWARYLSEAFSPYSLPCLIFN